ncbi:MAG: archaeosortase/exosortase family protein [Chitinophagales bacterium]
MLDSFLRKRWKPREAAAISFALRVVLAYGVWRLAYYYLETNLPPFWTEIQGWAASKIVSGAAGILRYFGEDVTFNSRNVIIRGSDGIFVADHCIGTPAWVVFSMFIILYAGKWYHKAWYIPFGAICIYAMNSARTAALAYLLRYHSTAYFEFSHRYIYTFTIYFLIFLLIVLWMEKISNWGRKVSG